MGCYLLGALIVIMSLVPARTSDWGSHGEPNECAEQPSVDQYTDGFPSCQSYYVKNVKAEVRQRQLPQRKYLIVFTPVFQAGKTITLAVFLFNTRCRRFRIVLSYRERLVARANHHITRRRSNFLIHLEVPANIPPDQGYTLRITGKCHPVIRETAQVRVVSSLPVFFIQTDKAVYTPRDKVLFRILGVKPDLNPLDKALFDVSVKTSGGSRVLFEPDQKLQSGFAVFHFTLSSKPLLGTWTIDVIVNSTIVLTKNIEVRDYDLPSFRVTAEAPEFLLILNDKFNVKVCSKYTHGSAVIGTATVDVCLKSRFLWTKSESRACMSVSQQIRGCTSVPIFFPELSRVESMWSSFVMVNVSVVEKRTGIRNAAPPLTVNFTSMDWLLTFPDAPQYFKPGSTVVVKLGLVSLNGESTINKTVKYTVTQSSKVTQLGSVVLSSGEGSVSIATQSNTSFVVVEAYYDSMDFKLPEDTRVIRSVLSIIRWFSPSNSFLKIIPQQQPFKVGQSSKILVRVNINGTQQGTAYYLWSCRGRLHRIGQTKFVSSEYRHCGRAISDPCTDATIQIQITESMVPRCRLLVMHVRGDGEVVTDSQSFSVVQSTEETVLARFSDNEVGPGNRTWLEVRAPAGSRFAISSVDPSSNSSNHKNFDQFDLINILRKQDLDDGVSLRPECIKLLSAEQEEHTGFNQTSGIEHALKRSLPPRYSLIDSRRAFEMAGLVYVTNLDMEAFQCPPGYRSFRPSFLLKKVVKDPDSRATSALTTRRVQSEQGYPTKTWLWVDGHMGRKGSINMTLAVPEAMLWGVQVLASTPHQGMQFSSIATQKIVRSFYTEILLPNSVLLGEGVVCSIRVYNLLENCISVQVRVLKSESYNVLGEDVFQFSIVHLQSEAVQAVVKPRVIGTFNVSVRVSLLSESVDGCDNQIFEMASNPILSLDENKKLVVKQAGVPKEICHSRLVCVEDQTKVQDMKFAPPDRGLAGTLDHFFSVVGDVIGPALAHLNRLIEGFHLDTGQYDMVSLVPGNFILDYLSKTGQLTNSTRKRARNIMFKGYQNELRLRKSDGSFSALDSRDLNGSTWLTAYVVKSLSAAKRNMYIDPRVINEGLAFLLQQQQNNGCFLEGGSVHNKIIMDGKNGNGVIVTAFVINTLIESGLSPKLPSIKKALRCVLSASRRITHPYGLAVMLYTLALVNHPAFGRTLSRLMRTAVFDGDIIYWNMRSNGDQLGARAVTPEPSTVKIETSSYALLALLWRNPAKRSHMNHAIKIARWLYRQQNSFGGFSSTLDSGIAVQALAQFSTLVSRKSGQLTINLKSMDGTLLQSFSVSSSNKLVLQKFQLPEGELAHSAEVVGRGCVFLQSFAQYHMRAVDDQRAFQISVGVLQSPSQIGCAALINICYRYILGDYINLTVIKVDLWSGFEAVRGDLVSLVGRNDILLNDIEGGSVIFYASRITNRETCVALPVKQVVMVTQPIDRTVAIYDYYDRGVVSTAVYNSRSLPCTAG